MASTMNGKDMGMGPGMMRRPPMGGLRREDDNISEWIKKSANRGLIGRLVLTQILRDGKQNVAEWTTEDMVDKDPQMLLGEIMEQAERDARHVRGDARYGIFAYHPDDEKHFSRLFFSVQGGDDEFQGMGDDQANEQGLMGMLMRHTDSSVRMAMGGFGEIIRAQIKQNSDMSQQLARYESQHIQVIGLIQAMLDRQSDRDLAIRKEDNADKRKAILFEKVSVLWPILAKKIFGAEGKDVGQVLGEEQLEGVLSSLSQEQMMTIAGSLNDEQRASFFELYKAYKARKAHHNGDGPDPAAPKKDGAK